MGTNERRWRGPRRKQDIAVEALRRDFNAFRDRAEPWVEFLELAEDQGLKRLLPGILEDANTRVVLASVGRTRVRRWGLVALVVGLVANVVLIADLAVSLVLLARSSGH